MELSLHTRFIQSPTPIVRATGKPISTKGWLPTRWVALGAVAKQVTFKCSLRFPRMLRFQETENVEFSRNVAFLATFLNVTFYTTGPWNTCCPC